MAKNQVKIKQYRVIAKGGSKRHPVTGRATSTLERRAR
jgi:hypothetical protein